MADVKRFNSKNGIENGAQESNLSMSDILISQHITGDNNDYKLTLAQAQAIPYGVCESLGDEDKTVNLINYPSTYTAQIGNKVLIKFIHANTKGHVSDNTYPTLTVGGVTKPIAAQGKTIGAGAIVDDQIIELVLTPDYWNIDQNIREVTSAYTILTDGSYIYNKTQIDNNNYTKAQTDSAINGALANYRKRYGSIEELQSAKGITITLINNEDNTQKILDALDSGEILSDYFSNSTVANRFGINLSYGTYFIITFEKNANNYAKITAKSTTSDVILVRTHNNDTLSSWEKFATESELNPTLTEVTTPSTQVTVLTGGYARIGNLVIVNIRFKTTVANTLISFGTNLPLPIAQSSQYIPCNVIDIQGDTFAETYGYKSFGNNIIFIKVPKANQEYALSCTYICQ